MLKHSRVSSAIDTNRLSEAVSRPGVDPRSWVSLAVVDDFAIDSEGVWADVTLMPSRRKETCIVGAAYAGNGFGFYAPLYKDDQVVVVFPGGDATSPVIVSRLHSQADAPPSTAQAAANASDVILVIESGKHLRIETGGAGNIILEPKGAGKVEIGGEANVDPMVLGQKLSTWLTALITALDTHVHTGVTSGAQDSGPIKPPTIATSVSATLPTILATKATVK
jgi:hypothetical protein